MLYRFDCLRATLGVAGGLVLAVLLAGAAAPAPVWAQDSVEVAGEETPPADDSRVRLNIDLTGEGDDDGDVKIRIGSRRARTSTSDYVRFGSSIHIPADQRVMGDVVAIGGTVTVDGEVSGDCVAVGGNIRLGPGAEVDGDAVSVGGNMSLADSVYVGGDAVSVWGTLDISPTAHIRGEKVEVGGVGVNFPAEMSLPFGADRSFGYRIFRFFGRIFWVLVLGGLGILAYTVFPTRMRRLEDTVQERGLVAFLAGFAGVILWLPFVVLLCVTIIGIPVALLVIALTPLVHLLGYVGVAAALGGKLAGASSGVPRRLFAGLLILEGLVLLGRFLGVLPSFMASIGFGISLLGFMVIFVAALTGFGAFLITRFRPQEPIAPAPSVPAAPPGDPAAATTL